MSSESRQTANSANAQLSTGPRTADGKARSSQNARKHGLTATHLVIAADDRDEFDEFLAELEADIRPQGALQQTLFEQIVASAWNLRRIPRMEAELTASAQTYCDILNNPELTAKLDRLARHKTTNERSFHRSLRELKSLQTDAAIAQTLPATILQRAQPLASKARIAKRTQALATADRLNGLDPCDSASDAEMAALHLAFKNHDSQTP